MSASKQAAWRSLAACQQVSQIVHVRKLKCLQRGSATLQTQTTLLGLSVPLLASLPRTWKAVISIKMPNATA